MEYQLQPTPLLRTSKNTFGVGVRGEWSPILTCATPGNLVVTYLAAYGKWIRFGDAVMASWRLVTDTFTHTTASGRATITGLPYLVEDNSAILAYTGSMHFEGITKVLYTQFTPYASIVSRQVNVFCAGSAQAGADLQITEMPTGGPVVLIGSLWYRTSDAT